MTNFENYHKISLNKYQLLQYLVKFGDIKKTSRFLKVPPFKIQNDLKSLEKQLGHEIFERNQPEFTLTSEGLKLASIADLITENFPILEENTKETKNELVISTYHGVAEKILPIAIKSFIKQNPTTLLNIIATTEEDFTDPELDIAIASPLSNRGDLTMTSLDDFPYFLYATKEYLNQNSEPKTLKDLAHHKIILFKGLVYKSKEIPIDIDFDIECSNFGFIQNLIQMGYGIGILPKIRPKTEKTNLVPVLESTFKISSPLYFITRKFSPKTNLIMDFMVCVQNAMMELNS